MSIPAARASHFDTTHVPWFGLALLACGMLAFAGGATHRHVLSLAAALLLLAAWLPRVCRQRSRAAFAAWLAFAALLLVPAGTGHPELALVALPVVFLAAAAWQFARSLRRGAEPLVARFIRVIEGEARLALPRVQGYARGVTVFWVCVLGAMTALSLVVALLAQPGGWLATFGIADPVTLPGSLLAWYPEAGCWAVLLAAFAGEYGFRRLYLRRIPQTSVRRFVVQMIRSWPALVHGEDGVA